MISAAKGTPQTLALGCRSRAVAAALQANPINRVLADIIAAAQAVATLMTTNTHTFCSQN
jgi:hypothetical protein